ncbi:ribosome maturation factor RimM [Halovulum dunhuangense]|uniref:Ribosome maturation factor RimM n=1 Tax=Halovulum dunhuangense TaxID=1505036 RepID=A0A849L0C0_9RHOB|nr:ribosome maturation factor RimM [Halovulum dunhuangense]NNU79709.1 ribosome maturation factor RimM [Halovulum dunhuangense]
MDDDPEGLICVGAITGAFGVRGEARVKSFCAEPEAIAAYSPLVTRDGRSLTLKITRAVAGGFAVRLGGVATREQAEALRGVQLFAPREKLPALPDDEFYHADLIGLAVVDTGGRVLGVVQAIHNHGAGDLLEVTGPGLKGGVLLPFTRATVPTVDLASGRLIADPPAGIFPEEQA